MIYTVTFNPAIDYVVGVEEVRLGEVNRSNYEEVYYGGKGINVSVILHRLGVETKALGFIAGFTGIEIQEGVKRLGLATDFIQLNEGMSRINVKIKSGVETEINGQGPVINDAALEALYDRLSLLMKDDILVLAGSVPNSLPDDVYERIMEKLNGQGVSIVVDATKQLLYNVLKYQPLVVKPNIHELGEVFGKKITSHEECVYYAKRLQQLGAKNVLVSMGGEGAILCAEDGEVYKKEAPKGEVKNSVGAGDSMLAGFLYGLTRSPEGGNVESCYEEALKWGIAAGSATAFEAGLGVQEKISKIYTSL